MTLTDGATTEKRRWNSLKKMKKSNKSWSQKKTVTFHSQSEGRRTCRMLLNAMKRTAAFLLSKHVQPLVTSGQLIHLISQKSFLFSCLIPLILDIWAQKKLKTNICWSPTIFPINKQKTKEKLTVQLKVRAEKRSAERPLQWILSHDVGHNSWGSEVEAVPACGLI